MRLKTCGVLGHDERIGDPVEVVSFDDTLGEIKWVVERDLIEDWVVPVS